MKFFTLSVLFIMPVFQLQANPEALLALREIVMIEDSGELPHWEQKEASESLAQILNKIDSINPALGEQDFEALLQSLGLLSELTAKYGEANRVSHDYAQASVQIASSGLKATQKLISFYESEGIDILKQSTDVQKGIETAYIGYLRSFQDEPSFGPEEYEVMVELIDQQHSFYFQHMSELAKKRAIKILTEIMETHKDESVRNLVSKLLGC